MTDLAAIDKADERPPYRQIAAALREAIRRGKLGPGDKLPSESELVERYGVARMTVRQAIQALKAEGLVVSEHGRACSSAPHRWSAGWRQSVSLAGTGSVARRRSLGCREGRLHAERRSAERERIPSHSGDRRTAGSGGG